jgi:stress responsive alpha/beta barrel protein
VITHVVIMKPRADLTARDREALIAAFEHAVREIPVVRGVRIGRRVSHGAQYEQTSPNAADFLIQVDFDDLAGLQAYLRHPAHEAVGVHFNRLLDSGWVYDFETGDLARLREFAGLEGETR